MENKLPIVFVKSVPIECNPDCCNVSTPSFLSERHHELTICVTPCTTKKLLYIDLKFIPIHHGTFRRDVEAYSTG
jgi:hypothetical protein